MTRIVLGGLQFTNKGESIFRSMTSVISTLFRYIFLHETQEIYVNEDTDVVLFVPDQHKTQVMCDDAVHINSDVLLFVPD